MIEFRMPTLGADMEAGKLVEWLVKSGDVVKRGQVIAIVETDKGAVEVECWDDGVVDALVVQPVTEVPVGTVLATLREIGAPVTSDVASGVVEPVGRGAESSAGAARAGIPEAAGLAAAGRATGDATPTPADTAAATIAGDGAATPAPPTGRLRATPAARRRAQELGIDLATVTASGADGAIALEDVERAAAGAAESAARDAASTRASTGMAATLLAAAAPAGAGEAPMTAPGADPRASTVTTAAPTITRTTSVDSATSTGTRPPPAVAARTTSPADRQAAMRDAIATAMAKSKREIPHYYLGQWIDLSRATAWLAARNAERPVTERVLFAAVLLTAIARTLREVPELNGFWVDGGFRPAAAIHLGVGIALRGGGLVAPAIHDAGERSVDDMMRALSDLVQRARGGSLRSSELTDATVTVTNLGDQGVETVYGVIYPPQVALVGLGKVVQRPWAEDGTVSVRPLIHATLSADHRASVGHRGALFLAALDRILQSPEDL